MVEYVQRGSGKREGRGGHGMEQAGSHLDEEWRFRGFVCAPMTPSSSLVLSVVDVENSLICVSSFSLFRLAPKFLCS